MIRSGTILRKYARHLFLPLLVYLPLLVAALLTLLPSGAMPGQTAIGEHQGPAGPAAYTVPQISAHESDFRVLSATNRQAIERRGLHSVCGLPPPPLVHSSRKKSGVAPVVDLTAFPVPRYARRLPDLVRQAYGAPPRTSCLRRQSDPAVQGRACNPCRSEAQPRGQDRLGQESCGPFGATEGTEFPIPWLFLIASPERL
jgi:hypothetical protein